MKRCPAAFAIAASLFAAVAYADDALEAKVRAYVPVVSLAKVCDIRINDAASADYRTMLEAVKPDPNADKLAYRLNLSIKIRAPDVSLQGPAGRAAFDGRHGSMKPEGRRAIAEDACGHLAKNPSGRSPLPG